MSLSVDFKNAVSGVSDSFKTKLIQLMFKSDKENFSKLASIYPIEANMVWFYKNDCPYVDENKTEVDYDQLEIKANINRRKN